MYSKKKKRNGETKMEIYALQKRYPKMTQERMAELLDCSPSNISQHIHDMRVFPEFNQGMKMLAKVIPDTVLIAVTVVRGILKNTIDGYALTPHELKFVIDVLKGTQLFSDKRVIEDETDPRRTLQSFIEVFKTLPDTEQQAIMAEFTVIDDPVQPVSTEAHPTDGGQSTNDKAPDLEGEEG